MSCAPSSAITRSPPHLQRYRQAAPQGDEGERSTYAANRLMALLSKMFSLAIRWEMRTDNPAKGVERNPEERRYRYLTGDELRRLTEALAVHPSRAAANAVRLLLLTGARLGEVLGATWGQFDLEAGIWTKPSTHTKQKREHRVPLSAPARQLLAEMRVASASPHLFPCAGRQRADGPDQGRMGVTVPSRQARGSAVARSASLLCQCARQCGAVIAGDRGALGPHPAGNDGALCAPVR